MAHPRLAMSSRFLSLVPSQYSGKAHSLPLLGWAAVRSSLGKWGPDLSIEQDGGHPDMEKMVVGMAWFSGIF